MNYEYEVTGLDREDLPSFPNTVVQVYWRLVGTDSDGFTGSFAGATPFENLEPDSLEFIPYDDLSKEDVISWIDSVVESDLDYKEHIYSQIDKKINNLKKRKQDSSKDSTLPWS